MGIKLWENVLRTVYKLFTQYLDLFGKPSREFLKKLFPYAEVPGVCPWTCLRKTFPSLA